ncbi:MAG: chemotaxis protein CheD [Syntrophobacterales bacterium]|jgi:chemotaxis protein CheD|nr:chemotaxis protein CheD [Syntrophobacterales bacterium]
MTRNNVVLSDYFLAPGYVYMSKDSALISTVVGSCVAVSLWDCRKEQGAMANFLYPVIKDKSQAVVLYGNVAISCMINLFVGEGSKPEDLTAQVFGGAVNPLGGCEEIGLENVRIAKKLLRSKHIPILSEDVGGTMGRKIVYNTLCNEAIVYKVNKLRKSDWYPYAQEDR